MESPSLPVLYKRKYADGAEVSSGDLQIAYQTAAQLVAEHGDDYLPLFERLHNEVQARAQKDLIRRRALAVATTVQSPNTATP